LASGLTDLARAREYFNKRPASNRTRADSHERTLHAGAGDIDRKISSRRRVLERR
jgi:hypothetical protein